MTLTKTSEDERRPHTFENTYSGLRAPPRVAIVVLYPVAGYSRNASFGKDYVMTYFSDMGMPEDYEVCIGDQQDALKAAEEEYLKESVKFDMEAPEDSKDYTDPDTGEELH